MSLIEQIVARAKSNKQRIVLPESFEERTITAADRALADGLADIILIGNKEKVLDTCNVQHFLFIMVITFSLLLLRC